MATEARLNTANRFDPDFGECAVLFYWFLLCFYVFSLYFPYFEIVGTKKLCFLWNCDCLWGVNIDMLTWDSCHWTPEDKLQHASHHLELTAQMDDARSANMQSRCNDTLSKDNDSMKGHLKWKRRLAMPLTASNAILWTIYTYKYNMSANRVSIKIWQVFNLHSSLTYKERKM